jgi:hypothetical protein
VVCLIGIPGQGELKSLSSRVDELSREVKKLGGKPAAATKRPAAKRRAK